MRLIALDDAAQKLGIEVRYVHFENADELPGVFAEMRKERDDASHAFARTPRVATLAAECSIGLTPVGVNLEGESSPACAWRHRNGQAPS
jgi:hypothetical protein